MTVIPRFWTVIPNKGQYRFGFNGQKKDDEITGVTGSHLDFGERIYDSRIGRFMSADPLIVYGKKFPELSPYQFASNSPIWAIDLDGLEAWIVTRQWNESDIEGFANYAKTKIQEMKDDNIEDDCANFALRLIVGYASENGLPLSLWKGETEYRSGSGEFSSVNQYLNKVRYEINAVDLDENAFTIPYSQTQAGDFSLFAYTWNQGISHIDDPLGHTLIFSYVPTNPDRRNVELVYGNFPAQSLKTSKGDWSYFNYDKEDNGKRTAFYRFAPSGYNWRWNVLNEANMQIKLKPIIIKQVPLPNIEPRPIIKL